MKQWKLIWLKSIWFVLCDSLILTFVKVNQKSGAQINVLPNTEEQSMVNFLIQGSPEQILVAQCALEKLATDCEVITDVIDVPQTAFGRIIGWCAL